MRVGVTSDWHGYLPPEIPECDLLLVAGDIGLGENFSKYDPELLLSDLWKWIEDQPMPIVAIAGNHDFNVDILKALPWHYLEDDLMYINGVTIWGSPWSNPFSYGWAFNKEEKDQEKLFEQIPDDVDIIISHGPPYGYCDMTSYFDGMYWHNNHVGSQALAKRMLNLSKLKLVACGHIHPAYGKQGIVVNGSLVNNKYEVKNKPIVVEI